ncbi:MAG TPA: hypothetical protein VN229_19690 [Terriglobales bacterium]|nr:hypothetical protein [Terriglobales bacterium]
MAGSAAVMDGARDRVGRRQERRKTRRLGALLLAALLLPAAFTGNAAFAQQNNSGADEPVVVQPDNSLPDTVQTPVFAAFWQRFRAAVRANDRGQLQAMTQLPFDFNGKSYGAADFAALAKQLYDAKTRHCLLSETPLHDQDMYEVFCGETVYVFGTDPDLPDYAASNPDGSAWRLIEIGAND